MQRWLTQLCYVVIIPHRDLPDVLPLLRFFPILLFLLLFVVEVQNILDAGVTRSDLQPIPVVHVT